MFNHCNPYICNRAARFKAILLMLLFAHHFLLYAYEPASSIKRIALLGDSMTWIGGDSCQHPTGWSHYLKQCGTVENIDVYARSGATWTNTTETKPDKFFYSEVLHNNNVVYNQALRLISDVSEDSLVKPDCIVIFAGANDAWFSSRRPKIFSAEESVLESTYSLDSRPSSSTSLLSSVALVCDILKHSFPSAHFIVVTPIQMTKVSAEAVNNVSDLIEKAAVSRGFTVLRADREVAIRHDEECAGHRFTYDGVHTNAAGAMLVAQYIIPHIVNYNSN